MELGPILKKIIHIDEGVLDSLRRMITFAQSAFVVQVKDDSTRKLVILQYPDDYHIAYTKKNQIAPGCCTGQDRKCACFPGHTRGRHDARQGISQ